MAKRTYLTLDGLRGIAALIIVSVHWHRLFGDFDWPAGALAVDLFFCLSGFVLAHAYEAKLPSGAWAFVKARFVRLYPLYILGTALGVIVAILMMRFDVGATEWTAASFWTALPLALVMLPSPSGRLFPFDGPMWSIFFELLINIVWAAFWKPLRSTRVLVWVIALSGVGFIVCSILTQSGNMGRTHDGIIGGLFRVSYSFFLGVLLYRFHRTWALPKVPPLILMAALPAILFVPMSLAGTVFVVLFVLPWLVLLGSQVEPSRYVAPLCRNVGAASYATYALHVPAYLLGYAAMLHLFRIDLADYAPWSGIVLLPPFVIACILLTRYYDAPVRKLLAPPAVCPSSGISGTGLSH